MINVTVSMLNFCSETLERNRGSAKPLIDPAIIAAISPKNEINNAKNDILLLVSKADDNPKKPNITKGKLNIAKECDVINENFVATIFSMLPPEG